MLALASLGHTKNPDLDRREAGAFTRAYVSSRMAIGVERLLGQKYQVTGPCARGPAMPDMPSRQPSHRT
jgi:hypothetical protein